MAHSNIAAVVPQESTADNDNPSALRPKLYITPSGNPSFVRSEAAPPKQRHYGSMRRRWSPGKVISVCNLRQNAIERLISGRHGGPCDTDDGEVYYGAAVRVRTMRFAAMMDDERNPKPIDSYGWAQKFCPRLATEHPRAWFEAQEQRILAEFSAKPVTVPSADDFARDLNITHAEVIQFKLRSVGAVDRDAGQRKDDARRKHADRDTNRRRKDRAVIPHTESLAQTKPWEAMGMSRSTYYRKVYAGELPKHPGMRRIRLKRRA